MKPRYVLLLEDNEFEAELLEKIFAPYGAISFAARTLEEASKVVKAMQVDIITIDIDLGGFHTGIEIIEHLYLQFDRRQFNPQLFILSSQEFSEEEKRDLIDSGIRKIFRKPIQRQIADEIFAACSL